VTWGLKMNSAGLTGLKQPHKGHVFPESRPESNFSAPYTKPILRPLPVVAHAAHHALMPSQASALKALTFGADVSTPAELQKKLPLPQQLIIEMQASKDPEEKAVIADMLGRSQVIAAVPALLEMTKEQHPPQVRSAAVAALGQIGNGTNPNSYTRATLNQELLKLYDKTKALLKADLLSKAKTDDMDALLQALSKTEKRQDHLSSLKVASVALGQLNVETGRAILLQEFKQSMEKSEEARVISEEIRRAIDIAKEDFVRSIEQQYQKPAEEIMNSLTQKELRALTGNIKVDLPDGQKIGVMQAEEVIRSLDLEQKFSANLMMGLIDGLAQQNDTQINNIVRLGLTSSHADVKAKSLNLLGQRNELNYNSDILPNLASPHKDVRLAALDALIQANDPAARQAVMEFLKPTKFFATLGQQPSPETMKQFVNFLSHLSNNGDQYILPLIKVAANADFDLERRALAMLVIQSMTQKPFRKNISQQTKQQAGLVIQSMALRPVGKDRAERDEVSLYATTLWVGMKDPNAVVAAVKLADDRFRGLTAKDQESLLEAVYMALQDDYMKARRDVPEPEMARFVTRVMQAGDKGGLNEAQFADLEKQLPQTQGQKALNGKPEEVLAAANIFANDVTETPFMKATRTVAGNLTPMLSRLHKHEKSPTVRMISARLLGLMKAKDQVEQLVGQTREPLKNMMDWSKDPAYKGNPTHDGANIRLNNILALGQLEDSRGVQVMLDALDDPTLRRHVLQPLSQLGKAVSAENNAETLKKVHDKLLMIVENPATSRLQRAIRMAAADTLYQFKGGDAAIKAYLDKEKHPEFKRHVASAFLKNGHGLSPTHPDHAYVKPLLTQGMGVEDLQAKGLTGKGVEIGIIDGGYVDMGNTEAFQGRVRLPAKAGEPEHAHPTMVLTTAGGNGPIKGVAPDVVAYSEMWPDFDSKDPMGVYKKIIEGKVRGENDIRVINNSWGFTDNNILIFKDVRQILKEFKKVVNLAEKAGVLFVFAAGNEGEAPGIPGIGTLSLFGLDVDKLTAESKADLNYIMDKVVLVGASNPLGSDNPKEHRLADFSSIGDSLSRKLVPTVLAPGVDMGVYGYENGKRTRELVNGTSFASPFVTGLTALLWQKNPSLSPAQVREILKKTAVPIPGLPDTYQGHGVVSPKEAVKMAESLIPKKRVKKPKAPAPVSPETQAQTPPPPTTPPAPTGNAPTSGDSQNAPEAGKNPEAPKTPQEPKRFIA
jgi:subtilisin family serine protease/HEAT repeat protein